MDNGLVYLYYGYHRKHTHSENDTAAGKGSKRLYSDFTIQRLQALQCRGMLKDAEEGFV